VVGGVRGTTCNSCGHGRRATPQLRTLQEPESPKEAVAEIVGVSETKIADVDNEAEAVTDEPKLTPHLRRRDAVRAARAEG
jgi:hypothetical protein